MKKTTLFALSVFLMTGIGFAQNIKTLEKGKKPQHPSEMIMKLDNNKYSKEELEKLTIEDLKKLKKELEEAEQQKTAQIQKYSQFAGTIAEEYIKTELAKNPNWEIKGISFNGVKKKTIIIPSEGVSERDTFPYTFTTTSGKKVITCEYDFQHYVMAEAVSLWSNEIMKAKYSEFVGTVAEEYIKTELGKNVDWQIKDISSDKKGLVTMMLEGGYENPFGRYTFVSTSGEYLINCNNKIDSEKMESAIKAWKNK